MSVRTQAASLPLAVLAMVAALLSTALAAPAAPRASATGAGATAASHASDAAELATPAVAVSAPARTDLVVRSSDGGLVHLARPDGGGWLRPVDIGGRTTSQPAAASWGGGRLDVFVRGSDMGLWQRTYDEGGWSPWVSRGGRLTSAPAVAAWAPGRLDVVARGGDGALWHRSYRTQAGWTPWRRAIAGSFEGSPALTSWAPGRLDVFAQNDAGTLLHAYVTAGQPWSGWEDLGGELTSSPAAAGPAERRLDVVARGPDGAFRHRAFTGRRWTAWRSLGGSWGSGAGAASDGGAVILAARTAGGALVASRRAAPGGAWAPWTAVDVYSPFRDLGTWVDVFDYGTLDVEAAVADMRFRGVRTLYLATARFTSDGALHDADETGRWLDAAHEAGLSVVGWYLPAYGDMDRDVERTVAIADFRSPNGQRFDAVGVDIERLDEVSGSEFAERSVEHLERVRARTATPIAAIVPAPFATDPGARWEGFPWAGVGRASDVVVPMALWSFRDACADERVCPYTPDQVEAWVRDQVERAREMTGRPVHVEGGVDDPGPQDTPVTPARVEAFVDGAVAGGAIGASHYDYRTTDPQLWPALSPLASPPEYASTAFDVGGTYVPVVGDFDGTSRMGAPGILWYAAGAGTDYLWDTRLTPDGMERTARTVRVGGSYEPFVADFDRDGADDIFWYAPGTAQDYVWYGGAQFDSRPVTVNGSYVPVPTDVDGRPAIYWYAAGGATDHLWLAGPGRSFTSAPVRQVTGDYQPVPIQGPDGQTGILWYAAGGAQDHVWSGIAVGGSPDRDVRVAIDGDYRPVAQYPFVVLYGPGGDPDQLVGYGLDGGDGLSSRPLTINGTYTTGASHPAGSVVWHAPGPGTDHLWSLPPARR